MTQKYKKQFPRNSKRYFSSFPDVLQPNLSDFPDVLQPDLSDFPGVFGLSMGATCLALQKNGRLGDEVAHTVMWKTLVVFGDRD